MRSRCCQLLEQGTVEIAGDESCLKSPKAAGASDAAFGTGQVPASFVVEAERRCS